MYCSRETLKLALDKGFTYCTCSNGGYPDCICESKGYGNVRLDDVSNWLRETHDYQLNIVLENGGWSYIIYGLNIQDMDSEMVNKEWFYNTWDTYYAAFEVGLLETLEYIK